LLTGVKLVEIWRYFKAIDKQLIIKKNRVLEKSLITKNNESGIMKIKKEVGKMPEQFKIDIFKSHQEKNLVIISTTN